MQRLKNITKNTLSNAWATLFEIEYDYQFKDGSWKPIKRESFDRGNGTCVFLYYPKKGTVILTKQFRMPAYQNDLNDGMMIEACAGAIDKNESPGTTIIREIEEEVGYRVKTVKQVLQAYTTPGAVTEKMYLFVVPYTDEMKVNEGGGLASENEEIIVLELPFSKTLKMMESGEIQDAKTIMLLQYAQIHKLLK